MKKSISFLLSILLAFSGSSAVVLATDVGMFNFQKMDTYIDGQFADVAPEDWYNTSVGTAYELGLMCGESDDHFNAAGQVTVAQTIVMAARLHRIYHTGGREFEPGKIWYAPYVSYARENGIISGEPEMDAAITRAQFADILAHALPEDAFAVVNEIGDGAIPDVKPGDAYAQSIYLLYRAGVAAGSSQRGAFHPGRSISRAEAAAIVTRIADESLRLRFTLEYSGPDLSAQEEMDDSFFENSAILGNSLVEGLRLYSNMKSLNYFSATSVSVYSATNKKNRRLNDGSYGTLVEELCQKQHDKIYIELGINEIGNDVEYFIGLYNDMLDSIMASEPDADIYIISVLPVTKNKSNSGAVYNMTRVNLYNEALHALAAEKQCYYMDVCSAMLGDDGYLPSSWSGDGVHLHAKYYSVWENCMRTLY